MVSAQEDGLVQWISISTTSESFPTHVPRRKVRFMRSVFRYSRYRPGIVEYKIFLVIRTPIESSFI